MTLPLSCILITIKYGLTESRQNSNIIQIKVNGTTNTGYTLVQKSAIIVLYEFSIYA